jgi:Flp pilus assembly pilin Flp
MDFCSLRRGGDDGQTTVEYATVVALAAIVIALALTVMPADVFTSFWNAVDSAL